MMEASYYGHYHVLEILIKKGFRLHDIDRTGANALFHAAVSGQALVIDLLLSKGANALERNMYGYSPLMVACANGHTEALTTILDSKQIFWSEKALERQADVHGNGLLHIAAHFGRVQILQILAGKGLDLNGKGKP